MPKEIEISRSSARRTRRTYSAEFKAQLVAACQQPGASIAALAGSQGMNANVLHRWLKEHANGGHHQLVKPGRPGKPHALAINPLGSLGSFGPPEPTAPAFLPLQLTAPTPEPKNAQIKLELHKGALSMTIAWPVSAATQFANWATALLK